MNKEFYDAIVVGSGAAGSIAVKELTERGMRVALLEAGPFLNEKNFPVQPYDQEKIKGMDVLNRAKMALSGQLMQARAISMCKEYQHLFINDKENPYTTPAGQYYLWIRGRQLGGRLHTYGRVLLRMSDYDFKAASRDGYGEDWPVGYNDLAPWYDRVEEFLGVYGNEEHIPNLPDGKYILPSSLNSPERDFKNKVESLWADRKVIGWRFSVPNLKRIPLGIQSAIDTGLLTIFADSIARNLIVDDTTGKATGVTYIDRNSQEARNIYGHIVVLCASAIESVRLLLNSTSSKHPNGLGNSSGVLGRYFLEQTPSLISAQVTNFKGWEIDNTVVQDPLVHPNSGGVYIPRFGNLETRTHKEFIRGFAFQGAIGRTFMPKDQPAQFGMMGFGEMLARKDNRITLDPSKKDAWGIPVAHIDCTFCDNDLKLMREQQRCIKEIVSECGYKIDFSGTALGLDNPEAAMSTAPWIQRTLLRLSFTRSIAPGAAIHESGGARMGCDPAHSVLNAWNQCWDAKNVFVTDASCFVSGGTVGPTLTIMALTARACEYIAQEYQKGNL
ncbi:GMC oxidoreductase [Klebsiella oxytoca]|uniref:GMC oxidoreductase n=1 Tax=Klebsiella oxytoca TaxID=571 RepID=UPI003570B3E7